MNVNGRTVRVAFGFALAVGLIILSAPVAQAQSAAGTADPSVMVAGLKSGDFWLTLLVALVGGALGGVVYELTILQGNLELPHKPTAREVTLLGDGATSSQRPNDPEVTSRFALAKHMFDLGVFARATVGSLAAVAALWVLSPETTFALLATAVVAGSAGAAVFRSIQDRLLASMALANSAETVERAEQLAGKLVELEEALAELREKAAPEGDATESVAEGGSRKNVLTLEDIAKIDRVLGQAEGIGETIGGADRSVLERPNAGKEAP